MRIKTPLSIRLTNIDKNYNESEFRKRVKQKRENDDLLKEVQERHLFNFKNQNYNRIKRLKFVREMIDLLEAYPDVDTGLEIRLHSHYCKEEINLVESQ